MKALIGFLIAALALPVFGQAPKTKTKTDPLLWTVKGKQNTVYLLGSLHVFKKEDYPLAAPINAAYAKASKVVFETDMGKAQGPEVQALTVKLGVYPAGETLEDHLSAATLKRLRAHVNKSGMLEQQFISMKPWLCGLTLSVVEMMKQGYQLHLGIDKHFYDKAIKDGKGTGGLEPVEFQIKLLSSLDEGNQEEFLSQTLDSMKEMKTDLEKMRAAWNAGDEAAMSKLIIDSFEEHPELYKKLLVKRNASWVPQIEKMLTEQDDVLVVVGSGHLVGKDSVVKMLEKKGWKPTR